MESFIATVSDLFPKLLHTPVKHEIFVLVICLFNFLFHILFITEVSKSIYRIPSVKFWTCISVSRLSLGRNLHFLSHWLLRWNQSLPERFDNRCNCGGGMDFWWVSFSWSSSQCSEKTLKREMSWSRLAEMNNLPFVRGWPSSRHHWWQHWTEAIHILQTLLEICHSRTVSGQFETLFIQSSLIFF